MLIYNMSEREIEWTNEQVIRLVNVYKARAMLWDPSHDLYRVQTAKYEAWCELAAMYGCEIVDLRKKFNSIFASHRREKAKIRMGGKSTWFLYNYLSFLPNHLNSEDTSEMSTKSSNKKRSIEDSEEIGNEEPSSDDYEENEDSNNAVDIVVKEEPTELLSQTPPKLKYFRTKPSPSRVIKRRLVRENQLGRNKLIERKIFKRSKLYKKKDECDSFGEYIAISLRKHDERTRSMIKQAINNILFEQEMKKYNSGQYTVLYSGIDENPLIVPDDCDK